MSSWFFPGGLGAYGSYANLGLYGALDAFGNLSLTETTPPQTFTEPITLSEIKSYLEIADEDSAHDGMLVGFISAARVQAEIMQNRDLVIKQWDLNHDYWPSYRVELRTPLISVDLAQYTDNNGVVTPLVVNTDYIVDKNKRPGVLAPPYNKSWPTYTPWPSSSLLIRFTSGIPGNSAWWVESGSLLKSGMKLLISSWFEKRIPFEIGAAPTQEYPYAVTSCLSHGAVPRAR